MLQPFNNHIGKVFDVTNVTINKVVFQYGDNFIISLIMVQQLDSPNNDSIQEDFGSIDGPFTDNTDVQRITIAPFRMF